MNQTDSRFEINQNADMDKIGKMVVEAMIAADENDVDSTRDIIFDLYNHIYPHASRVMTQEEITAYKLTLAATSLHRAAVSITMLDHNNPVVAELNQDVSEAAQLITDVANGMFPADEQEG